MNRHARFRIPLMGRMKTDSKGKYRYNHLLAWAIKLQWAAGERVARVALLNRNAPEVGGIYRDVPYLPSARRQQRLDVFVPPGEPPWPVMVYVHGGANHFGDKGTYDRICKVFASQGFLVFNANYRLSPRWKYRDQLSDTAAAVNFAWRHAQGYGGDPSRVFLAGDSAGAYHAAMYAAGVLRPELARALGTEYAVPRVNIVGLLLFYGVFDLATVGESRFPFSPLFITGFLGRDPGEFASAAELVSPVRWVGPDFPPCFLATSEIDPLHSQTLDFARRLADEGVDHELLVLERREFPLTYHGFLNFWFTRGSRLTTQRALSFTERLLGNKR